MVPTTACHYDVRLLDDEGTLDVAMRCDGNQMRELVASEAHTAHHLTVSAQGEPLAREGARFRLPAGAPAAASYRLSLDAVAYEHADIDVAYKAGPAWMAAVSTFVLRPQPIDPDTIITLSVETPKGMAFASGLSEIDGGRRQLRAREIPYATYAAFGAFTREELRLPARGEGEARVEIVTLPGNLLSSPALRRRWLEDAARAIADFWHGFPVPRACLVIIPTPGHRGIAHGKVVAAGGPTVAIHFGAEADEAALYGDWILVHELFHLGFPSFAGEGKWLDEGLATYYEPIIRARAGWRSEESLWRELAGDMPQGLAAVEQEGVDRTKSFKGIYWGGAILAFMADVAVRKQSGGALGLEDGLRALLAEGGNATEVWKLRDAIAVIDRHLGAPVLGPLAAAHGATGSPVPLRQTMRDLGVELLDDGVRLDDTAPLAAIRHAIGDRRPPRER
ncbi:MAG: hypothetical protein R3B72_36855 [Polyangiaceae bacterium]